MTILTRACHNCATEPVTHSPKTVIQKGSHSLLGSKPDLYQRLRSFNQRAQINCLPPEILCHIFEMASHVRPYDRRSWDTPSRTYLPITVSQVSEYWREIALGCPLLWSHIDISPPWSFNSICLALDRARDCPLTISLNIPDTIGNPSPSVINASGRVLCDIIAPHIPRCQKLVIKGDFCQLEPFFLAVMKMVYSSPVPFLQNLVIYPTNVGHLLPKAQLESFVQGIPSISHLRITSGMLPYIPSLDTLKTLHLSAADGQAIDVPLLSEITASSPHLETLAIYDNAISGPWLPETVVDFPKLRSLRIYGSFMSVSDLLRVVEAPLLEDLVIAPFAVNDLYEYREHIAHSPPKFTTLKSITLSPVSISGFAQLEEAAECFPTVELVMIPNIHADSFCDVFTVTKKDMMVWPCLKALALRNVDCTILETLLDVVASREAAGRPLETLYLDRRSIQRVDAMLPIVRRSLNVVEFDVWSTLHDGDLLQDAAHFVGNDFDFLSSQ